MNSVTGSPVEGASVTVNCRSSPAATAITGANGAFELGVGPDAFEWPCALTFEREGFLKGNAGAEINEKMVIQLVPDSVLTGTVLDENGGLFRSVRVAIFRRTFNLGRIASGAAGEAYTDERGRFRIAGLTAARYVACIEPQATDSQIAAGFSYRITCQPQTAGSEQAESIELGAGESRDMTLRASGQIGFTVSGRVTNPEPGMRWSIIEPFRNFPPSRPVSGPKIENAETGEFEFHGVLPGKYYVESYSRDHVRRAAKIVEVATNNVSGIQMTLGPLPQLTGKFRMDDGSPWTAGPATFYLNWPGGSTIGAIPVSADGVFRADVPLPGVFRHDIRLPEGPGIPPLYIAAMTQGTRNVLANGIEIGEVESEPLDVVVSSKVGSIEGTLKSEPGAKFPPSVVMLYRRSGPNGNFEMAGTDFGAPTFKFSRVRPGEYSLYAWPQPIADLEYQNPDFVDRYKSFGRDVEVREGLASHVELELVRLR